MSATTLTVQRVSPDAFARAVDDAPPEPFGLADANRRALATRLGAIATDHHRRLDSWLVERGGRVAPLFAWSPLSARRLLGGGGFRRALRGRAASIRDGVRDEIEDLLARAASGRAHRGSLGDWLAHRHPAELALVQAAAVEWARILAETGATVTGDWAVASADAYYDVERARTTLRARRDLLALDGEVVVRVRAGGPTPSAGPGLRADLAAATFAHPDGRAPRRYVGIWPDAGIILAVDGTLANVRAGTRDLVRATIALNRQGQLRAA